MATNAKHTHNVHKAIAAINKRLLTKKTAPATIIRDESRRYGVLEKIVRTIGKFPE